MSNEDEGLQTESQEELENSIKQIEALMGKGRDGSLVTLGKQELGLLQRILSTGSESYKEEQFWRMCSFLDEDEAKDHVDAFYEARDLGMDVSFNVAYAFALVSTNRKTSMSNLIAMLTDTLQHAKWASAQQGAKKSGNSRSPIGN